MKFENTRVFGFENAIIGLRLPMCKDFAEAKLKCDSTFYNDGSIMTIGENDLRICKNLIKADNAENKTGAPNSKFLRMIHVQVCITAPQILWSEIDTYKVGTVANSTSKMHTLGKEKITRDCFERGDLIPVDTIDMLEILRLQYIYTHEKKDWEKLLFNLPSSWLQTRMFDCNYEVLRNIASWRKNHKLKEWSEDFLNWIKTLPLANEFILPGEANA